MSTPPPSSPPPPGGYYPSPPPAKSNNAGCFKAVGITCGVLLVIGFIGAIILVRTLENVAKKGGGTGFIGVAFGAAKTQQNGIEIQKAIQRYHDRYNKYPNTLTDLVPDTLTDGKILHSDIDPDPSPGHVSWIYHKPTESAPSSTPMLEFHYRQPGLGATANTTTPITVTITIDGKPQVVQEPPVAPRVAPVPPTKP